MTAYQFPMFAKLKPRNHPFKGGRIIETDPIPLDEAAKFASRHAGTEITPADFLRAAARGEITLRAIVHREAKLQKHDGGVYCNQGEPTENTVPKGCIPNLPLSACRQLANTGRASWRTLDGFEQIDGELMRFTAATLIDSEPDFETVLADCRVTGDAVHALADEYIDTPAATSTAPEKAAPLAHQGSDAQGWKAVARSFATDYIGKHKEQDLHPSQADVSDHVAKKMREMKIYGPQGKPLTASSIQREAIQGEWWRENG